MYTESLQEPVRRHCYFAAPLFTVAERRWNEEVVQALETCVSVYLPQRDGILLAQKLAEGADRASVVRHIFDADLAAIRDSALIVAVLDGAQVDDGVAFEMGAGWAFSKPIFGLATDSRREPGYFRNPMWEASLRSLHSSERELLEAVRRYVESVWFVQGLGNASGSPPGDISTRP
jgi:nucleoside 2-deoxyribosyltransferase